jgi:hypothetical protein
MRRNALLLLCAVVSALLIASLFHGERKAAWSIPATNALAIATPCASAVTINPDPALHGQVDIIATARNKYEITQLQSHGGATALLSGAGSHCLGASSCTETQSVCAGMPDDPTLKLTISVPENIALSITEAQGADYNIGDVAGPLTLDLSGSGDVSDAGATTLDATLTGSGDAHLASVTGPINATLADSGDLDIAEAAAPSANFTLNGDGDVNIAAGSLGALNATLSHDGDLHVPAATDAKLMLTADGDVVIGQILGYLDATLTGDGDLSVTNVTGDATLSSSGDGDITIPHIAGHLTQTNTGDGDFKINGS